MMSKIFFKTCFILCMFVIANANGEPSSHCNPDEKIFFSCPIGKKYVSLCESIGGGENQYLEYRYGKLNKIELRFKGGANDSTIRFNKAEVYQANNGGTEIWFNINETYYVLSAPIKGGPYLEIFKKGNSIARLPCNDGWGNVEGDPEGSSRSINNKTKEDFYTDVLNFKK